jgi:hypothetical protein
MYPKPLCANRETSGHRNDLIRDVHGQIRTACCQDLKVSHLTAQIRVLVEVCFLFFTAQRAVSY